jgi:hypothetical protein
VEFFKRADGIFESWRYFGQHLALQEFLCTDVQSAEYEVYRFTGDDVLLPKSELNEQEKLAWLAEMQHKLGPHGTPYCWTRLV